MECFVSRRLHSAYHLMVKPSCLFRIECAVYFALNERVCVRVVYLIRFCCRFCTFYALTLSLDGEYTLFFSMWYRRSCAFYQTIRVYFILNFSIWFIRYAAFIFMLYFYVENVYLNCRRETHISSVHCVIEFRLIFRAAQIRVCIFFFLRSGSFDWMLATKMLDWRVEEQGVDSEKNIV